MFDSSNICHGYAQSSELVSQCKRVFGDTEPENRLADKVFQLVFANFDGSTFPFAFWPVTAWQTNDVLSTILESIEYLNQYGFKVSN